jgi:hypothetical protein
MHARDGVLVFHEKDLSETCIQTRTLHEPRVKPKEWRFSTHSRVEAASKPQTVHARGAALWNFSSRLSDGSRVS